MFKCEEKWEEIVRTSERGAAIGRGSDRIHIRVITILIL
jgi:hypothetical protein